MPMPDHKSPTCALSIRAQVTAVAHSIGFLKGKSAGANPPGSLGPALREASDDRGLHFLGGRVLLREHGGSGRGPNPPSNRSENMRSWSASSGRV